MKHRYIFTALIVLNILVIAIFVILFTGATYPLVGGDYRLFGPRLLDALLHYKVNGLSIQWYTPSFGGGLPAYPNPLQTQFSLPQLFTFFVNPWIAILASSIIYVSIGFWVTFLLLRDVMEFKPFSSILGANFLVSSGFFIEQMVSGHADKITFPLIVIPVYALLNRKLPAWLSGVLISLTGAIVLYSGGEYIAVIALFTAMVTLPVIYFLKPSLFGWRKMVLVIVWGAVLTLLLCGSKLYAVAAFTRSFPRGVQDHYFVAWSTSIGGLVFQLVGVMTTLPILNLFGKSSLVYVVRLTQWTGSPYGFWELDSSISPALIILLIYGAWMILFHKPHFDWRKLVKKGIAGITLIFAILIVVQYSTARGFLFDIMKGLPLFMSLRTNTRFVSSFVLPLAILGSLIFDHLINGRSGAKTISAYVFLNGISLVSLWAYYLLPLGVQGRYFDISAVLAPYSKIQAGNIFPVNKIIPAMNDYEVFQAQASNVTGHYDVLLGENSFHPLVHAGSVFDINNGFFNMTDPTGYVFPRENNSKIFSLIPVSDYDKLVKFLNRRQPDWKLPLPQVILDWAAGFTFILEICAVCVFLMRKWLRRKLVSRSTLHPS
ncbi:MAG: hypothetical protein ABSG01_07680 [Anaerolineales bacterium]